MTALEQLRARIADCKAKDLTLTWHPEDLPVLEAAIDEAARRALKAEWQRANDLESALRELLLNVYARPDIQSRMGLKERAAYERGRELVNKGVTR